jgi:hypothetical protein
VAVAPPGARAAVLPWLWFAALALGLLVALGFAWRHTSHVEEFPQACDSFGYLQAAADIRQGHAPHGLPPFTAGSPHVAALVNDFESHHANPAAWQGLLGPQAYNYCPASGKIINQYPPGVPLLLALFPAGQALHWLYTLTLALLTAAGLGGIAALAIQYRRTGSVLSLGAAGVWAVAAQFSLMLLGTTVSYSVDFASVPLLATLALLYAAYGRRGGWIAILVALAGAGAGYALLMRVTIVLFVPGFLALVYLGAQQRRARLMRAAVFLMAGFCAGVLPLLLHQQALTGALWTSTYGRRDVTAPTLDALATNAAWYFTGDGSLGNWALLVTLLGAAAAIVLLRRSPAARALWHWLLAAATLFLIPTAFYLTHTTTTPYYQLPTILVTVAAAALALAAAARGQAPAAATPHPSTAPLLLLGLLLPGLAHLVVACIPPNLRYTDRAAEHDLALPAALRAPNVWIYGERFTGTLWYYHGLHAQNPLQGTPQTRYLLYRFAFDRGEKQYLIYDVDSLEPIVAEARRLGATFPQVGHFDHRPVVEIVWPPAGPTPPSPAPP